MQFTNCPVFYTLQLINLMEQSTSWEVNSASASQEVPPDVMDPEGPLRSQRKAIRPHYEPDESREHPLDLRL